MYDHVFKAIADKFDDAIDSHKEVLSQGGAQSFDQYAEFCGVIKGYRSAMQDLEEVYHLITKQDQEEDE